MQVYLMVNLEGLDDVGQVQVAALVVVQAIPVQFFIFELIKFEGGFEGLFFISFDISFFFFILIFYVLTFAFCFLTYAMKTKKDTRKSCKQEVVQCEFVVLDVFVLFCRLCLFFFLF